MSRLTRDGTAKPVSRDQNLRHERGQGNIYFPHSADHGQDWQPYPADRSLAIGDDHSYIMVTTRYSDQNRDPNRDTILARSNRPRTSETYRRQDGVLWPRPLRLSTVWSDTLSVFHDLNYKLERRLVKNVCCPSTQVRSSK